MQTLNASRPADDRFLAHILSASMPRRDLERTALPGAVRVLAPGEMLFTEGDDADGAFEVMGTRRAPRPDLQVGLLGKGITCLRLS